MTIIVQDNFNDTANQSLNAHTPDVAPVGASWNERVGDWLINASNRAALAAAVNSSHATIDSGVSDNFTLAVVAAHDTGSISVARDVGAVVRWSDTTHYWMVSFNETAQAFRIVEWNGTPTTRATVTVTITPNTFYTILVTVSGQTITATFNGGSEISYNAATLNQSSTVHGITGRDTTMQIESFLLETAGGDPQTVNLNAGTLSLASRKAAVNPTTYADGVGGDVNTGTDLLISSTWPTFNGGQHESLALVSTQSVLLRFNLSAIPADADCISATLYLYHDQADVGGAQSCPIYSVSAANSDWIEGAKNIALASAGEPTWNGKEADGAGGVTTPWAGSAGLSTAGADFEAPAIGAVTVDGQAAVGAEWTAELDTERVKNWFGASNTNYGILIKGTISGEVHSGSSESATPGYRPKLVVRYKVNSTAQTVTAVAGALTISPQPVTVAVGAVTVEIVAGSFTATGQPAEAQPGAVTISINAGALAASGQQSAVQAGAVTVAVGAGAVSVSGQQAVITAGAVAVAVQAGTISASGQQASLAPGAVSVTVTAGAVSAAGQPITVSAPPLGTVQINVNAGYLTASGQPLAVQPGAVAVTVTAGAMAASGQPVTAGAGEIPPTTITVSAGGFAAAGQQAEIVPGPVTIVIDAGALAISGFAVSIIAGDTRARLVVADGAVTIVSVADAAATMLTAADAAVTNLSVSDEVL